MAAHTNHHSPRHYHRCTDTVDIFTDIFHAKVLFILVESTTKLLYKILSVYTDPDWDFSDSPISVDYSDSRLRTSDTYFHLFIPTATFHCSKFSIEHLQSCLRFAFSLLFQKLNYCEFQTHKMFSKLQKKK